MYCSDYFNDLYAKMWIIRYFFDVLTIKIGSHIIPLFWTHGEN